MSELKTQIGEMVGEIVEATRGKVGAFRNREFGNFIEDLIKAKEGGLDVSTIQLPLLSDSAEVGVEVFLTVKKNLSAEGGFTYALITLGGKYGKEEQTAAKVNVSLKFYSAGAMDLEKVVEMSPEELTKLLEIVNQNEWQKR